MKSDLGQIWKFKTFFNNLCIFEHSNICILGDVFSVETSNSRNKWLWCTRTVLHATLSHCQGLIIKFEIIAVAEMRSLNQPLYSLVVFGNLYKNLLNKIRFPRLFYFYQNKDVKISQKLQKISLIGHQKWHKFDIDCSLLSLPIEVKRAPTGCKNSIMVYFWWNFLP